MKKELLGITWASLSYSWYLPLLLVGIFLVVYYAQKKNAAISVLSSRKWRSSLVANFSEKRNWFHALMVSIAMSIFFIALLRPQWDKKDENIQQQGRDLIIALDVSRSMLAQDMKPNRLEFAKKKIKELVNTLASERISLVLFSGEPIVQCPLTTDYAAFLLFLDQIDSETISSGTTALDRVLQKVLEIFKDQLTSNNKALVMFTDGEDFSSNLVHVKEEAHALGLPIITVGVGTPEGAPLPIVDEQGKHVGYQKDENDTVIISQLNEGILMSLAQGIGGVYVHAQQNTSHDIQQIIVAVEKMEKAAFEEKKVGSLHDQYPYFVGVGLAFLIGAWLL